jgi:hypothetical protein
MQALRNGRGATQTTAVEQEQDLSKGKGQKAIVRDEMCDDLCLRRSWLLLSNAKTWSPRKQPMAAPH